MARINISEFQFVFAFFHKFMSLPQNKGKNFIVPSLLQEGGVGGGNPDLAGTDLIIEDDFFFQFKVGHRLKQACSQTKSGQLLPTFTPFFRFKVKNSPNSRQFSTLIALAQRKGKGKVYYIAPKFDYRLNTTTDEEAFNDFWQSNAATALSKTIWIDFFQWVGRNPYQAPAEHHDNHVICYNHNSAALGNGYMFSEKKEILVTSFDNKNYKIGKEAKSANKYILEIANILQGSVLEEVRNSRLNKILDGINLPTTELIKEIQEIMLFEYDILWTPILSKKS